MKKVIISLVGIIVVLTGCSEETTDLTENIKDSTTIELGSTEEITINDVINDIESLNIDINKISIDYDKDKLSEIGTIEGSISFEEKKYIFDISIEDTTTPVFDKNNPKEITLEEDSIKETNEFDITKYIKAADLTKVSITTDIKNVKFNEEGTYPVVVKATDTSNNISECTINIIIEAKQVITEPSTSTSTTNASKPTVSTSSTSKPSTTTPNKPSVPDYPSYDGTTHPDSLRTYKGEKFYCYGISQWVFEDPNELYVYNGQYLASVGNAMRNGEHTNFFQTEEELDAWAVSQDKILTHGYYKFNAIGCGGYQLGNGYWSVDWFPKTGISN